ncbi:HNH endonuclease domain-containing protein [Pochonia chlamydosporia 170]|uniref:HNH endonuclease domain-containing protein n=1 Tax=Pochonia chlamydosporia 170 TaxID=1380566 RepID=A0A179EY21_METCM|nr:HNH endonuclease domain-containing protein [Pochonia chlamydosporia 170]OAQ58068.1 HNH endonuclease domain-containing protein [Pochonia chlamydosporia 170]
MSAANSQQVSTTTSSDSDGPTLNLKTPRTPFRSIRESHQTFFLHPGYPEKHNILLILPALDSGGIHHETARIACAILANSRWDGFLSLTKDGPKLEEPRDAVLPSRRYYFRIEGDDRYPVVPSFDNFPCPLELPDSWCEDLAPIEQSSVDDVGKRDQICRVTGSSLPNENAHIIPQAQSEWWQRNSMFAYTVNADQGFDTKCADNTILVRRDTHKMWDDHRFAIVPKAGKWVAHVLWNSPTVELEEYYHNLELQPLRGVSRYFLLCRFALAILSKSAFLSQGVPRRLITIVESGSTRVRSMSADEYRGMFNTSRANSRSQSPKKRQRSTQNEKEGDEHIEHPYTETLFEMGSDLDEPERGRPRKRRCSWDDDSVRIGMSETSKRWQSSSNHDYLETPPRSTSPIRT